MTQLTDMNTRDIADAIRLGCRTMSSIFNADDDGRPFFASQAWPNPRLGFSRVHCESHVPGRHLMALLHAEEVLGVDVREAVEKHRKAAFFSFGGPLPLPLNREAIGGRPVLFCPHNVREGIHALYALVKYRKDGEARDLAERSIECVLRFWNPETDWRRDTMKTEYGITFFPSATFVTGLGRALGPLAKYHAATGSERALRLAVLLRDKLEKELLEADITDSKSLSSHVHSNTCCLSSLAQWAAHAGDASLMERVKAFYDRTLWLMRDEIGWSPESIPQTHLGESDHGEGNNSGDILETALILGRAGFPGCYGDAERILRCHLLPSQLRDVSFIRQPENPLGEDGLRDLADRHRGAWGFPAPYGHRSIGKGRGGEVSFNMDIVGGVTNSLCEAYVETVRGDTTGLHVNMLFDHEGPDARVGSPYGGEALRIEVKRAAPLWVRIPSWADREALRVEPADLGHHWSGAHLFFPGVPAGATVRIRFPMTERRIVLTRHHVRPIRVDLRGDEVKAMDCFDADWTFFPAIG